MKITWLHFKITFNFTIMDIIDYMNENYIGIKLNSLNEISSNNELASLILAIRSLVLRVEEGEIAAACYKTAILMVNNVEEPYWRDIPKWKFWVNPKNNGKDPYFLKKSEFALGEGKQAAINNLILQWNKNKVVNVEFFLRSFEVMARNYVRTFEPGAIKEIINSLMPLIELANQDLKNKAA